MSPCQWASAGNDDCDLSLAAARPSRLRRRASRLPARMPDGNFVSPTGRRPNDLPISDGGGKKLESGRGGKGRRRSKSSAATVAQRAVAGGAGEIRRAVGAVAVADDCGRIE